LRSLADLVAAAKARPGQISYGSTGIGSDDHLLVIAFEEMASVPPMTHAPFMAWHRFPPRFWVGICKSAPSI